jgi:hypothetical protein
MKTLLHTANRDAFAVSPATIVIEDGIRKVPAAPVLVRA